MVNEFNQWKMQDHLAAAKRCMDNGDTIEALKNSNLASFYEQNKWGQNGRQRG